MHLSRMEYRERTGQKNFKKYMFEFEVQVCYYFPFNIIDSPTWIMFNQTPFMFDFTDCDSGLT